jgi:phage-related protein
VVAKKPRAAPPADGREPVPPATAGKRIPAVFFRTESGGEPVRDWLKALPYRDDRKRIGEDIMTVEFGWPVGMPVCRPLGEGVYETRTDLPQGRIARVLFYIDNKRRMVLLHGFIKKTPRTPDGELAIARRNKRKHEKGLQ